MATLQFNANNVQPAEEFKPLDAGWYKMVAKSAELKPNSKGTGTYIALELESIDQGSAGRKVFANLTYNHPNEKAQEIGQRQLSAICHAINVINLTDTAQLLAKPFLVKLAITAPTYNVDGDASSGEKYPAGNEAKAFKAIDAAEAGAGNPAVAAPPGKPGAKPAKPAAEPVGGGEAPAGTTPPWG